ncbi:hypothetical protein ACT7DH_06060 [Bacillus pacificus]
MMLLLERDYLLVTCTYGSHDEYEQITNYGFLLLATKEYDGSTEAGESYVQISSIMPQSEIQFLLNTLRALQSSALGEAFTGISNDS